MRKITYLKRFILLFFIIVILFALTGCGQKQDNGDSKEEKVDQEIGYLDSKIITMMNQLNNISFSNYKVTSENVRQEQSGAASRK